MNPIYTAILGFICGVIATILGFAIFAVLTLQQEAIPEFVSAAPTGTMPTAPTSPTAPTTSAAPTDLSPVQQEAVRRAYEAIDEVERTGN